ncbi:MAG: hypothetical protein KatS3mg051_2095 [Anaerolineae bacterium]|nr:MAG: hypothetical protein KatS3mg051_2078 [Anaerolineae bacterium]GIV82741.1 MAG: hypothetical protein KatS3mg051_2095 [Anaerolineae bacterium]
MNDDLKALRKTLLADLRVELMALHLGDDKLVTEPEAAALLGVHPETLARLLLAGAAAEMEARHD